ncbi:VOC family protein [Naasia sp. SYSU D00948]|uniref:VOC family protein n=1 Tax=Naasia sp. SYSU D00948 TaxID=2817379 RepID=UPI001B30713B|nr:VOC family protein [Naasia sp. SYSU D00948]
MVTRLNPYLNFRSEAREAMTFYQSVFGGELNVSTFGEYQLSEDPSEQDKVMHAQLDTPNGLTLMGADTPNNMEYKGAGNVSVSLSGEDESELRGYWEKLSDGATIVVPLETAPWGDAFGMLTDRYGIDWLVNIAGNAQGASAGQENAGAEQ